MKQNNVLCIDIEGGHGGSSRSLFFALKNMDRENFKLKVIVRRGGPIVSAYQKLGISCQEEILMPRWTGLYRTSRNLFSRTQFIFRDWPRSINFRKKLLLDLDKVQLLHLNHISLTDLAVWVRKKRPSIKIVMHIRTMPYLTYFSKAQANAAFNACDSFVFITENELDHFESQVGKRISGEVIYHPVELPVKSNASNNSPKHNFQIASLSNYSYFRGVDRLKDVLLCLSQEDRKKVKFVVAGDMTMHGSYFSKLFRSKRNDQTFPQLISYLGLGEFFDFKGHIQNPEEIMKSSDLLMKLTRENNPWGRDIVECLSFGVPVVSIGTYDKFVETDKTGLLQTSFDPNLIAEFVVELINNKQKRERMSRTSRERIKMHNDAPQQGQKLLSFWKKTLHGEATISQPQTRIRFGAILPALNVGGAEKVLLTLSENLPKEHFQKRLLIVQENNLSDVNLSGFNFVHNLSKSRLRLAVFQLFSLISNLKLDIVFSSQVNVNIVVLLISICLPSTKVVVREANMPSDCLASGHWPRWYLYLYKFALNYASAVIVSSSRMESEFNSLLKVPLNKIFHVRNPVDISKLRDEAKKPVRRSGAGRRFVAVARLVKQKGFDRLIRWMLEMPVEDHLTILGDGPDMGKLSKLIVDLKLQKQVSLDGFISRPSPYISGADALLAPSLWEGQSNSILESLAIGTPVITFSSVGGAMELASELKFNGLKLVKDRSDFLEAMKLAEESECIGERLCLLPNEYNKNTAGNKFKEIITGIADG